MNTFPVLSAAAVRAGGARTAESLPTFVSSANGECNPLTYAALWKSGIPAPAHLTKRARGATVLQS